MSILPIYNCYHPILSQPTEKVKEITTELKQLVQDMFDTLNATNNGVGLAANQIGKSLSLFVIDVSQVEEYKGMLPFVCINPLIVKYSEQTSFYEEGCLSAPDFYEEVERPNSIIIRYFDSEMQLIEQRWDGFLARVMQHEYDHLQGIVFYEKLSAFKRTLNRNKLRHLKAGEVEIDYIMVDAKDNIVIPSK